jgi:hypothetical protein
MNRNQVVSVLLLLLVTFGLSHANGNLWDSRPILNDTLIDKVDRLFAPWNKGDTPGAAVIVIKDGQILLKICAFRISISRSSYSPIWPN